MRGADLLVGTLANAGVKVIFTLSGNQIMPVFDACLDAGIRLIHTRHEGAAVYMAEGYAQLTGEIGVALVTAAPGFGNALGPLYMARAAENPVLLLSGDSSVSQDGQGAFQELDQVNIAAGLTKFSHRPLQAESLGRDTAQAIRIARSGRAGPTHLALAFDVLNETVSGITAPKASEMSLNVVTPNLNTIQSVVDTLAQAVRPVVITGPALNQTRAGDLLTALSNSLDTPVIAMESPRGLNDPSLGSYAALLKRADVVLSLGKNIDFTTGFGAGLGADDGKVLVIDPDLTMRARARAALGERLQLCNDGDPKQTAQSLVSLGQGGKSRASWRRELNDAIAQRQSEPDSTALPMRPAVLCAAVQRLIDRSVDPILVIDGGEFGQWSQALVGAEKRLINGPSGAIGGGLCYAIAAKIARPGATVILMMGDGTAGFHFAEFETAHRYGAAILGVIGHDAKWNAEYQIQLREYGAERLLECELDKTRYDQAAAGFGCHGEYVTDPAALDEALSRAIESGLPACVAVEIEGLPAPSGVGH